MRVVVRVLVLLVALFVAGVVAVGVPVYRQIDALNDDMEEMTEQARSGKLNDQELTDRFIQAAYARGFRAEPEAITVQHPEPGTVEMKATFKTQIIPNTGWELTVGFHSKRP